MQAIEVFNVNESAELSERDLEAIAIGRRIVPACSPTWGCETAHVISDGCQQTALPVDVASINRTAFPDPLFAAHSVG